MPSSVPGAGILGNRAQFLLSLPLGRPACRKMVKAGGDRGRRDQWGFRGWKASGRVTALGSPSRLAGEAENNERVGCVGELFGFKVRCMKETERQEKHGTSRGGMESQAQGCGLYDGGLGSPGGILA